MASPKARADRRPRTTTPAEPEHRRPHARCERRHGPRRVSLSRRQAQLCGYVLHDVVATAVAGARQRLSGERLPRQAASSGRSVLGVLLRRSRLELEADEPLVSDDPGVVTRLDDVRLTRAELNLGSVVMPHRQSAGVNDTDTWGSPPRGWRTRTSSDPSCRRALVAPRACPVLGLSRCDKPPAPSPRRDRRAPPGGRFRGPRVKRARARLPRSRPRRRAFRLAGREANCAPSVNASERVSTASPCRCFGFSRTRDRQSRRRGAATASGGPCSAARTNSRSLVSRTRLLAFGWLSGLPRK
jgi:hypothetical protein